MRKIIKNKYSLYKTINVSVQCSLKKKMREREKERKCFLTQRIWKW